MSAPSNPKRFKLKSKTHGEVIVTIDEQDAYLLRSQVWSVSGGVTPCIQRTTGRGISLQLSHVIKPCSNHQRVRHANGDPLDFRRENLVVEDYVRLPKSKAFSLRNEAA